MTTERRIGDIMAMSPVIPVLTITDLSQAEDLAVALVVAGLPVLEVTLRTPVALEAVRIMRGVPGALVGAGTVLGARDLDRALDAGAEFIVSPGLTEALGRAAIDRGARFLPGTANASDLMRGLELGFDHFKFFPAMAAGGIAALKALLAPLHRVRICPTGGIGAETVADWLAIPQVLCVGGSWMMGPDGLDVHAARSAAALRDRTRRPRPGSN